MSGDAQFSREPHEVLGDGDGQRIGFQHAGAGDEEEAFGD